jgi:hypothetical protein
MIGGGLYQDGFEGMEEISHISCLPMRYSKGTNTKKGEALGFMPSP